MPAVVPSSSIQHYENFPVASWLCPPHLRAPITALYHFARTADDIADEGDATAEQRLQALAHYRADLHAGPDYSAHWPRVFAPLFRQIMEWNLPLHLLEDLLDAFEQDVQYTAQARWYADELELANYCRRSANPVGRLLLHLYGATDELSLTQSDCICSALQYVNFWQDLSVDIPRGRFYVPLTMCEQFGVTPEELQIQLLNPRTKALIAHLVQQARVLMLQGADLARRLPGRMGWELRLVIQGGLRIADKIEQEGYVSLQRRPKLGAMDAPPLLWRALTMYRRPL